MRLGLLVLLVAGCVGPPDSIGPRPLRVLLFGAEGADVGWYHTSNPIAARVMTDEGARRGWATVASKDPNWFTDAGLAQFDVVVFLLSSGTVLDDAQEQALRRFMAAGKGYAGVHSASFTQPMSDWYISLVGVRFAAHAPGLFVGDVVVERQSDPMVAFLPRPWMRTDEWYTFVARPESNPSLEILLTLDESTLPAAYPSNLLIGYHAISWRQTFGGGRSFYTAMGHTDQSWSEDEFVQSVAAGIEWAGAISHVTYP